MLEKKSIKSNSIKTLAQLNHMKESIQSNRVKQWRKNTWSRVPLHWTVNWTRSSPYLFRAMHVYCPASSVWMPVISKTINPKSFSDLMRELATNGWPFLNHNIWRFESLVGVTLQWTWAMSPSFKFKSFGVEVKRGAIPVPSSGWKSFDSLVKVALCAPSSWAMRCSAVSETCAADIMPLLPIFFKHRMSPSSLKKNSKIKDSKIFKKSKKIFKKFKKIQKNSKKFLKKF